MVALIPHWMFVSNYKSFFSKWRKDFTRRITFNVHKNGHYKNRWEEDRFSSSKKLNKYDCVNFTKTQELQTTHQQYHIRLNLLRGYLWTKAVILF